jgi:FHA domain-containing protein/zinc ribbon protein
MEPSESEGVACPTCHTMNEAGWAFCQQCGSKLPQAGPPPPRPPAAEPPREQQTVVAPPPTRDPIPPPTREPVAPPREANIPLGQPTVMEQPQRPPQEAQTPPLGRPTVVAQPPREANIPLGQPTVVDQPPPQRFNAPPAGNTESVQSVPASAKGPGINCQQCGHANAVGSAFCAACGTPIPVAKTIVMSSVVAPPKGRLHLIMEGGQQGEVYDLKEDTMVGRVGGDISFPHDGFMSGRHARIARRGSSFYLTDEGSRNGTFIKIKGEVELKPGDMVLIGKQLFRFEL